jgi:hypothetical protein
MKDADEAIFEDDFVAGGRGLDGVEAIGKAGSLLGAQVLDDEDQRARHREAYQGDEGNARAQPQRPFHPADYRGLD